MIHMQDMITRYHKSKLNSPPKSLDNVQFDETLNFTP